MNANDVRNTITHNRELIKELSRYLQALEIQESKLGVYLPPHITIDISDTKKKIEFYENEIKDIKKTSTEPTAKFIEALQDSISWKLKQLSRYVDQMILLSQNIGNIIQLPLTSNEIKKDVIDCINHVRNFLNLIIIRKQVSDWQEGKNNLTEYLPINQTAWAEVEGDLQKYLPVSRIDDFLNKIYRDILQINELRNEIEEIQKL